MTDIQPAWSSLFFTCRSLQHSFLFRAQLPPSYIPSCSPSCSPLAEDRSASVSILHPSINQTPNHASQNRDPGERRQPLPPLLPPQRRHPRLAERRDPQRHSRHPVPASPEIRVSLAHTTSLTPQLTSSPASQLINAQPQPHK